MFDVGSGILQLMEEYNDYPIRDSVFFHPKHGSQLITTEYGFGWKHDYVASNASGEWLIKALPTELPLEPPTEPQPIVSAIDVSSHQTQDLTQYITQFNPDHIIIRFYQDIESQFIPHTRAQVDSARYHNKSIGGYGWLYRNYGQHIETCIDLADDLQVTIPILWIDVEPYQNLFPTVYDLDVAIEVCKRRNQRCGIYTGKWVWDVLNNPTQYSDIPLWHSHFNDTPNLQLVEPYGSWTKCAGHQYTSSPIDRSIFDVEYTHAG